MKNIGGVQKFRIPFKNLSDHDIEVEFNFMQTSSAVSQSALLRQDSAGGKVSERQSPVEFSIQPNVVKIPAGVQAVMLNISAKLKNSYVLDLE